MRRTTALPELLAPCGTPEALYAAMEAGADAVYLGGECFSARAHAGNFSPSALADGVLYAHLRGKKVYTAVNTLIFDREMPSLLHYAESLATAGVDGLIMADMGAATQVADHFPSLSLHASTQMSVHSLDGARALCRLGFSRIVPARELCAADIQSLIDGCEAEIEIFLHGALCVCHSGQCLFSSMVGGRSGNRGSCAQPCRLPYNNGKYPLSLKDLALCDHIPALISSGVSSLKIEGRMKSPEYVYGVCRIYRRLLDEGRAATPAEKAELAALFSRNGFTDGYYTGQKQKPMTGIRREEDKRKTEGLTQRQFSPTPLPLRGELTVKCGQATTLCLSSQGKSVVVEGEVPSPAQNMALTEEGLKRQMTKLGGSFFTAMSQDMTVQLDEGLFLPMGAQNALRRAGVSALEDCFRGLPPNPSVPQPLRFSAPKKQLYDIHSPLRTAVFYRPEVFAEVETDFFDLCFLPLAALPEEGKMPQGVLMPAVTPDSERAQVMAQLVRAKKLGIRYALCGGLGAAAMAAEVGMVLLGDLRLNITNRESAVAYRDMGFSGLILSPELSLAGARDIGFGSVTVLGRIPLMVTERCFMREIASCDSCGKLLLTDRRGAKFPMLREYPHRNLIFNSLPTYMGDKRAALRAAGICGEHFIFSNESKGEVATMISAYRQGAPLTPSRRLPPPPTYFTNEEKE